MSGDPWGISVSDELDFSNEKKRRRRRRSLGGWRQLPGGRWQYRVRGIRPNGAPFQLARSCEASQRELVELQVKRLAEEYRAGLASPAQAVTLKKWQKDCVRSGMQWSKQNESTWHLLRSLHDHKLEALDLMAVQKWVSRVLYRGKGRPPKGKAGPGYLRHGFELLRRLVKRAVAMRTIPAIPWGDETPPSIPRYTTAHKRREPIPESDLFRILEYSRANCSDSVYIRVLLSAETGSRPHELARARRSWLKPVSDVAGAPAIEGAAILALPGAKGGYPHDVPISSDVYGQYLRWFEGLPLAARETGLLVPILYRGRWREGKGWVSDDTWAGIIKGSGCVEHYCLYQLRHTRLAFLANECGPRVAQAIAGHTSVVTTERYTGRARGLVPGAFHSFTSQPRPDPLPPRTKKPKRAEATKSPKSPKPATAETDTDMVLRALTEFVEIAKSALKPVIPTIPTEISKGNEKRTVTN
jgi:integrase